MSFYSEYTSGLKASFEPINPPNPSSNKVFTDPITLKPSNFKSLSCQGQLIATQQIFVTFQKKLYFLQKQEWLLQNFSYSFDVNLTIRHNSAHRT